MFTRRDFLKTTLLASLLSVPVNIFANTPTILKRTIPKSGEAISALGMGTWQTFHVPSLETKALQQRIKVLNAFFSGGGVLIDSSPMYANAQEVLGLCFDQMDTEFMKNKLFSATKVWSLSESAGLGQIDEAETLWREPQFDLMQIHNLLNWKTHLKNLQVMQAQERIRYIGVTTSHRRRHAEISTIMQNEAIDFVQFSYSIENRLAEKKLLPLAQDQQLAVIINRPFQTGYLFQRVAGKALPDWANEIQATSWAQFFVKFILSHPAVTVVIPATQNPSHMSENMQALSGSLPDQKMREEMIRYYESVSAS